jgi:hypothetical protein
MADDTGIKQFKPAPMGVVGGQRARDVAVNHIAKSGCKGAAEIEVRYKDEKGNTWRDKIEGGRLNERKCLANSPAQAQRIREREQEMLGSRRDKSLCIPAEAWDRIFGSGKGMAT